MNVAERYEVSGLGTVMSGAFGFAHLLLRSAWRQMVPIEYEVEKATSCRNTGLVEMPYKIKSQLVPDRAF